jgi:hypothetical protein
MAATGRAVISMGRAANIEMPTGFMWVCLTGETTDGFSVQIRPSAAGGYLVTVAHSGGNICAHRDIIETAQIAAAFMIEDLRERRYASHTPIRKTNVGEFDPNRPAFPPATANDDKPLRPGGGAA